MLKPKVTVGRKWDKGAVFVGRGSLFGNPFNPSDGKDLSKLSDKGRDEVCDKYEEFFPVELKRNPEFRSAVIYLVKKALSDGELVLGCFCSPKRCHAETIKDYVELILEGMCNK